MLGETHRKVRVLLADDHRIMLDGLHALLEQQPHVEIVGEASDGRTAVEMARATNADCVVMDIAMPEMNGVEATRRIVADNPAVKVVALSMHSDRRFVSGMLAAGAHAYLLKGGAFDELVDAIDAVIAGRTYLSQGVASVVVEDYVRHINDPSQAAVEQSPLQRLSAREREVLQLAGEGKSTKEIAAALGLSTKTVESHRRQVMEKLGIFTLAGLIKLAIKEGLVPIE